MPPIKRIEFRGRSPQNPLISCKFRDSFNHWYYFHKSWKTSIFWSYSGRERPSSLCISVCFCLHYARAIDIPGLRKRVKFKPTKYYLKIQSYLYCLCSSKLIWTFLEFKLKALLMSCVSLFRKTFVGLSTDMELSKSVFMFSSLMAYIMCKPFVYFFRILWGSFANTIDNLDVGDYSVSCKLILTFFRRFNFLVFHGINQGFFLNTEYFQRVCWGCRLLQWHSTCSFFDTLGIFFKCRLFRSVITMWSIGWYGLFRRFADFTSIYGFKTNTSHRSVQICKSGVLRTLTKYATLKFSRGHLFLQDFTSVTFLINFWAFLAGVPEVAFTKATENTD